MEASYMLYDYTGYGLNQPGVAPSEKVLFSINLY